MTAAKKMKLFAAAWLFFQATACWSASRAFAHAIWIEKDSSGAGIARFGEYENDLRETGIEKLSDIVGIDAWIVGAQGWKQALEPVRKNDGFYLGAAAPELTAQVLRQPVREAERRSGAVKPYFYARYSESPSAFPDMRLDAVPDAAGARVYFDGSPLAGEKVVFIAPNGWIRELKTDAEGEVALDRPWPGLYVLEVTHVVEKPGTYEGRDYALERHRATLSFPKKGDAHAGTVS